MATNPLGAPIFRAFDSNGAPLTGGFLYAYAGGTSTPQTTYTDETGTVANANPVVLDSTGSAQVWLTPGLFYKFVLQNSLGVQQYSVDMYPSPSSQIASNQIAAYDPGGRLTMSNSLPVTTADTTDTTVRYLPYKSDQVPLYNGSSWSLYSIGAILSQALSDTTLSPAAAVANTCYDLFVWLKNASPVLSRGPAWVSDTSRGSGAGTSQLTQPNGRWVNAQPITNGPAAQCGLYVGTIRTDGSIQVNDTFTKRHCWNMYNRVTRPMKATDAASTWGYTTAAFRQANANAANQLDMVIGLSEDDVLAETLASGAYSATGGGPVTSGVGVDSTTVNSALSAANISSTASAFIAQARYRGFPGIGRHFLAWLEYGATSVTLYGTNTPGPNSGITGELRG